MSIFQLRISSKLPIGFVVLSLLTAVVTAVIAFMRAESAMEAAAFDKLKAVQQSRLSELSGYLDSIKIDVTLLADNDMIIDGLEELEKGWTELGDKAGGALQKLYIDDNPNKTGEKHKLDAAKDGGLYSRAHAKYHPWLRSLMEGRGYYDIFLVTHDGKVAYTVFKEPDFATDLNTGKWKDTDLAKVVNAVRKNFKKGFSAFTDLAPYAASDNAPASFIAAPIFDREGKEHGVMVVQMPVGNIVKILANNAGMGDTGETFIVGADALMRSDSRFEKESTILKKKLDMPAVGRVIGGETGQLIGKDYRKQDVLVSFAPLEFLGTKWGLIAKVDMAEVDRPIDAMRNNVILAVVIIILVVGGMGLMLGRAISRPIAQMTGVMGVLAGGNLDAEIPSRDRTDEIGEMAAAVQVFKDNAVEVRRLQAEQEAAKARAEQDKRQTMNRMADQFLSSVGGVVDTVSSASTEMQSSAQSLTATAEETSRQSAAVSAAADQASHNVETVASAAEELSSSISEISRQVTKATEIAGNAVTEAKKADRMVQGLADAASKIGEVIKLITDIASQTNLLALNATIEAARAGEAGKGFAVVASEVKNLANQTAKATEEIGAQISGIQGATRDAVKAIQDIGQIIGHINEISTTIASAVEEQGAATKEIARNVEQASAGTGEVTRNIEGVNQAAGETGHSASQVLSAASELSQQSEKLRAEVDRFVAMIRKA